MDEKGFIVEKNQIKLDKPIKELGIHSTNIKLHPEVQATISLIISRTEAEAESLLKGEVIDSNDEKDPLNEESIELEEVFEEGAVPEDINTPEDEKVDSEDSEKESSETEIIKEITTEKED